MHSETPQDEQNEGQGNSPATEIVQAKLVRAPESAPPAGLYQRAKNSRAAVLAVLFLMTGFLGIPLLWMNPKFSTAERWIWAIVVTIYTCALIALVCWVVMWSWNSINSNL